MYVRGYLQGSENGRVVTIALTLDAFIEKSVKPEIVNRYDLWVLRHKIGGAKVFISNVQWSDQMM